ncbi:MAG TPA: adenylate/guanylate cyclase domain-containing protein [Pseudomonadota bacterium]|nr:adenylate/guanylate cyclase domain-containing protein [Stellaceae bacterium]HKN09518.1 adenylate/guanylate cyclase domain-containing protein [Pseudomonadota bacterium]
MSQTRRLAAILAADVAGYSRLMGADEEGTLERLKALRRELLDPTIAEHHGRIVKTTGDGMLVEFASVVDAVRCAVAVQQAMPERNTGVAAEGRIELRIGINLGDVIVEGDDLYGDGVNIAARIEALADAGGVFISNTVHDHVRDRLPFIFEDLGEQQVKNIARAVRVYRVRLEGPHPSPPPLAGEGSARSARVGATEAPPLALPDKPSIAVLPFANMSGDPEQEYFADGMVEEIITALSRIRWLFVIARNSTFTYKGQAVDVTQVGRELGVRYVLEGSVRKGGNQVRITAQLIDSVTGTHLWADRFDGLPEDVFDLQDKVAVSVAGVIEPALHAAETAYSAARRTEDLTAYDLYLRAYALQLSSAPDALRLLDQAIGRDPQYGPALALAASFHATRCIGGWSQDPEAECLRGTDLARRALQVGSDDPGIIVDAAAALAYFGEDIGAMMGLIDRALALNPSFARGWNYSGLLSLFAGHPERAIEHAEVALHLSPRARVGTTLGIIGTAHLVSRRFDQALPKLLLAIQEARTFPIPYRWLASCYAHMGRLDEARDIVNRLRAITPVVVPTASWFRDPEQ